MLRLTYENKKTMAKILDYNSICTNDHAPLHGTVVTFLGMCIQGSTPLERETIYKVKTKGMAH